MVTILSKEHSTARPRLQIRTEVWLSHRLRDCAEHTASKELDGTEISGLVTRRHRQIASRAAPGHSKKKANSTMMMQN
jgi:hypothetical protein